MITRKTIILAGLVLVVSSLVSVEHQAAYTWVGTSNAWNSSSNWSGGTGSFPVNYNDQAIIGSAANNPAEILSGVTILLGGGPAPLD